MDSVYISPVYKHLKYGERERKQGTAKQKAFSKCGNLQKQAKIRTYQNLTIYPIHNRKGEQLGNGGKNMDTQKEKKLKPCPFCGKEPYIQKWPTGQNKANYAVRCRCGVLTHFMDRRYKAVEIWNRRA